jgi:2-polyprenyl-6-hydroxyphenyl methylase/3-demethylubiquinone-9 3-methyltransferase
MTGGETARDYTVDPDELAKFAALGREWWDPTGPMAPLHKLNPLRVAYVRDRACDRFGRDPRRPRPLDGLSVLDIGCGGGLLAEPLARLGGRVTAIDPLSANVEVARWHADEVGVEVDYRVVGIEALAAEGRSYDLVIASEVIEHVVEIDGFVAAMALVARADGLVVLSTLSRTIASLVKAIIGAEYLLGWLPRGTHDWRRFLTPAELGRVLRRHGLRPVHSTGVRYDGSRDRFVPTRDLSVNYLLAAVPG